MKYKLSVAAIGVLLSPQAGAVSVPNVFNAGDPAVASEINENFTVLENAINAGGGTTFSDYFLAPSSTGALGTRNVIVWQQGSSDCYVARGWFTNTTDETVNNGSTTVTPDEIFVWQQLCGDNTTVTTEGEYVYAVPSAGGFDDAQGISIKWDGDGDGAFEDAGNFGYKNIVISSPTPNAELLAGEELYYDGSGDLILASSWSRILWDLGESVTINGMEFSDVVVASFAGAPRRTRLHAKGIGAIHQSFGGDPVFSSESSGVIFYRIEGKGTAGSLAGTPFASADVTNQWFQP